jgi:hypothetical protein
LFQTGSDDGPKFAEFYFSCFEHTSQGEDDQAVPLYLILYITSKFHTIAKFVIVD